MFEYIPKWLFIVWCFLFILGSVTCTCLRYGSDLKVYNDSPQDVCVSSTYQDIPQATSSNKEAKFLKSKRELWFVNMMIGEHEVIAFPASAGDGKNCKLPSDSKITYKVKIKKDEISILKIKASDFK